MTLVAARSIASPRPDHSVGMFDDNHKYHWQGGPALSSVTTVLKLQDALIGGDLAAWGGGIAADWMLENAVGPATNKHAENYTEYAAALRGAALRAVSAKRDIGSAVHGKIEDLLSGKVWTRTPETGLYLDGFSLFMAEHHPRFIAREEVVISLRHEYAGRFDFIAEIAGRVAIVDVKTGKLKASHRLQLAGYAASDFIGKPDDPTQYPLPRIKDFYVLLLREGSYELVPMAVTREDRRHFLTLAACYAKAKAWERTA